MKIRLFILTAIIAFFGCEKQNSNIYYDRKYVQEIKQVRDAMGVFMAMNSVPGAQITIYKEGNLIYSEAFGNSSKELKSNVTHETKFRLGNSTGILTSMAYYKLVENGTLHPDSSIYHYLPDFPKKKYNITLGNLIQNSSGFEESNLEELAAPGYNYDIQQGIELFKNNDLIFTPGDYQTTSVFDYNLLGAIMEKETGKNFTEIISEFVTDTLQLKNTVLDNPYTIIDGRSAFYDVDVFAYFPVNTQKTDLRSSAPSMGYLSTSEDLAKFGNAILHSPYVSGEIREKLFKPFILSNGITANMSNGWKLLKDTWERNIYCSIGNITGGGSSLLVFPDDDLVVSIMMNLTLGDTGLPDYQIATFFLEKTQDQIEYEKYQEKIKSEYNNSSE
ncbi:MAG: beta-lactamase family protein [Bacteroidales bacterium]|jgi:CubicO group peptidase (beta-lactamase class C family)|nr:beta-lactamase family protein [Bacteroidales bacterium]